MTYFPAKRLKQLATERMNLSEREADAYIAQVKKLMNEVTRLWPQRESKRDAYACAVSAFFCYVVLPGHGCAIDRDTGRIWLYDATGQPDATYHVSAAQPVLVLFKGHKA